MYHPRLYGGYYDMGLKYGTLLYEKANFRIPKIRKEKHEFGLKSYPILQRYYPEVVEEIKGFAKGIQDSDENLAAFLLSIGVLDSTAQCSVFAFKNDNEVFFGRNYDMLFAFKKFTESSLIVPQNKYAYIAQSDVFIGRVDGVNEKGLAIAISFVNGTSVAPGINFHFVVRKVLEDCATTAQAIQLIESIPVSTNNNFIIADQKGHLVVVESSPKHKKVRQAAGNYIYSTNQFVHEEMKVYDRGGVEWSKSHQRYVKLEEQLSSIKDMSLAKAKAILSDECICLNLKEEQFGTIWSVVSNLTTLEIERAERKPRNTNYKKDARLDWWLKKKKR
ncbi:MAG: C45 family autoproteolytic acyltransferase/hydrolase [Chitinophagales bacterium]|nr:C45 family autoproteolytic acyltransferase/hydrolase [Chitinophagales bacterium]